MSADTFRNGEVVVGKAGKVQHRNGEKFVVFNHIRGAS
jgi:hypothetical protein